jgi:hypothetical protein
MKKSDDARYVVKVRRKIQFSGNGGVAVISLPAIIRQTNGLVRGDLVEIVFDLRKPNECKLVLRKVEPKEGGNAEQG